MWLRCDWCREQIKGNYVPSPPDEAKMFFHIGCYHKWQAEVRKVKQEEIRRRKAFEKMEGV